MNEDTKKFNVALFNGSKQLIRQNNNTPYKGTEEDKLKILQILEERFDNAVKKSSKIRGERNLLYYAVFGVDYTMLLEVSLKTLIINKINSNFDVLLITDKNTLKVIRTLSVLKEFNWHYYLVPVPVDGVEASVAKIKVFDYPYINKYNKILFLDTDVICLKNFLEIFDIPTEGKFEAGKSPLMRRDLPHFPNVIKCAGLCHSLSCFTEKNKEYIAKYNPPVFNAGHFYFENTEQMEQHFNNIIWLVSVWPSAYFYEQSFLNQYFNFNDLTSYKILDKHIGVTMHIPIVHIGLFNIPDGFEKQHEDTHSLLHFAGTPTNGRNKYQFIKYYCEYFNICL